MNMVDKEEVMVWLRGDMGVREYMLFRRKVSSIDEVLQGGDRDVYLAIFSEKQLKEEKFDTIFLDIDGRNDKHNGYYEFREVLDKMKSNEIIPSRVYFSGRGYHIYLDLEKSVEGKGKYKHIAINLVKALDIEKDVDNSVIGDVRRIARVPSSINTKSGLYMIRISPDVDEWKVIYLARRDMSMNWYGEKLSLEKLALSGKSEDVDEVKLVGVKKIFKDGEYPPCIRMARAMLEKTGELNHAERLQLALFLLYNDEEGKLREWLKWANDYNESISSYQIDYLKKRIASGNMMMFKCERVSEEICPFTNKKQCMYYPLLQRYWLEGEKE